MAKVEIDEAEFVRLQGLNNFAHKMLSHPEGGLLVEQAAKLVDPNAKTPRLDAKATQIAPTNAVAAELAALRKQIEDDKAEAAKNQTLNALQAQRDSGMAQLRSQGWTAEGLKGVEELMAAKGLLDPLDAAILFEKQHPPQNVAMPGSGGGWNFMDGITEENGDKELLGMIEALGAKDEIKADRIASGLAGKALHEVRQAGGRR